MHMFYFKHYIYFMFALVDCNNFYASCERVFNPSLQQKPIVILSNNDGCIISRSDEAKELGIPVSLSTVRGFVTKKGAPAARVKELEAGMMKAMGHNYYKNFLTEIGLDDTSVVGADEWGKQMEEMLKEMTAQLKALGYLN